MEQLKKLLSDISEEERQEALDYYESYFDDAGQEKEAMVIRELGSPGKVAAIIKADLESGNRDDYAEYTELGYEDARAREPGQMPDKYTAVAKGTADPHTFENEQSEEHTQTDEQSANKRYQRDGRRSADRADSRSGRRADRAERGYHAQGKGGNAKGILLLILPSWAMF